MSSRGVGLAACSLFGGTVIGSIAGLHPVGVVGGVAARLLVWDLGTHGLAMRAAVGGDTGVEPARSHALGTVLVIAAGGVLASSTLGASRLIEPAVESSLAGAAIGLALLAVVALASGSLSFELGPGWRAGAAALAGRVSTISRVQALGLSIPLSLALAFTVTRWFLPVVIACLVVLAVRSPTRWRQFDDWVERY